VEQEEAAKKLSKESTKLKRDFNLAQATNLDLEKKVTELADALKKCQDENKIAEDGKRVAVVWTSLGPLPRWVPEPTTRWAPRTTRLALHGT
jgi:hypothetical protein